MSPNLDHVPGDTWGQFHRPPLKAAHHCYPVPGFGVLLYSTTFIRCSVWTREDASWVELGHVDATISVEALMCEAWTDTYSVLEVKVR